MGSADDGQTLSTAELAREVATLRNALAERDARLAAAEARVAEVEGELAEEKLTWDLWHAAEKRGVAMWREANPGKELSLPDTAEYTSWLIASLEESKVDRDRLAAANAELQAEIDRINDAQAASLGAEVVRLAKANAAKAREIERLRGIVDRLPKTADGVVRLVDDPVWLRYETETTRVIRGRVCYRGDEAVGYFAEDRDGDNFIDWSDEYPVSECFATEDAARRGAVVPRGDSPAAVDPRAALLHIATMDVFTRDGEELPHETMRRIAIAALAPAADASGEATP